MAASTALALGVPASLAASLFITALFRLAVSGPAHLEAVPPAPTSPPPTTPLPELAPKTLVASGHGPRAVELPAATPAALTFSSPYANRLAGLPMALLQ